MSFPTNRFTEMLALGAVLSPDKLLEMRSEYDVNNNLLYVGYSPVANADPDDNVFYILKGAFDGNNNPTRLQKPDEGEDFLYSWTNRATYFS